MEEIISNLKWTFNGGIFFKENPKLKEVTLSNCLWIYSYLSYWWFKDEAYPIGRTIQIGARKILQSKIAQTSNFQGGGGGTHFVSPYTVKHRFKFLSVFRGSIVKCKHPLGFMKNVMLLFSSKAQHCLFTMIPSSRYPPPRELRSIKHACWNHCPWLPPQGQILNSWLLGC
jgi:hypothetical protein